jgi:hypothetical protein
MIKDLWEAAGPSPEADPRPGTGTWDVCAGWVDGRYMRPRRLYGWQLVERLTKPLIVEEKARAPVWMAGRLVPDAEGRLRRCKAGVESLSMLVLDCDDGAPLDTLRLLGDCEGPTGYSVLRIGHTSYSHSAQRTKARIVFPLSAPVAGERWEVVWAAAARWAATFGVVTDKATKDPSRIWFTAACPADRAHLFESWVAGGGQVAPGCALVGDVALLDPAWLVRTYPEPPRERINRPVTLARFGADCAPEAERRAGWVHKVLEHRVTKLATMPKGAGQSMSCYGNGRKVGQAEASGWITSPGDWLDAFVAAGRAAGLDEGRARASVQRGYAKGLTEAWEEVLDG